MIAALALAAALQTGAAVNSVDKTITGLQIQHGTVVREGCVNDKCASTRIYGGDYTYVMAIYNNKRELIFSIDADGSVFVKKDADLSDTAKRFWQLVNMQAPGICKVKP